MGGLGALILVGVESSYPRGAHCSIQLEKMGTTMSRRNLASKQHSRRTIWYTHLPLRHITCGDPSPAVELHICLAGSSTAPAAAAAAAAAGPWPASRRVGAGRRANGLRKVDDLWVHQRRLVLNEPQLPCLGHLQDSTQHPQRSSRAGGAARSAPGAAAHYSQTKRQRPGTRALLRPWLCWAALGAGGVHSLLLGGPQCRPACSGAHVPLAPRLPSASAP